MARGSAHRRRNLASAIKQDYGSTDNAQENTRYTQNDSIISKTDPDETRMPPDEPPRPGFNRRSHSCTPHSRNAPIPAPQSASTCPDTLSHAEQPPSDCSNTAPHPTLNLHHYAKHLPDSRLTESPCKTPHALYFFFFAAVFLMRDWNQMVELSVLFMVCVWNYYCVKVPWSHFLREIERAQTPTSHSRFLLACVVLSPLISRFVVWHFREHLGLAAHSNSPLFFLTAYIEPFKYLAGLSHTTAAQLQQSIRPEDHVDLITLQHVVARLQMTTSVLSKQVSLLRDSRLRPMSPVPAQRQRSGILALPAGRLLIPFVRGFQILVLVVWFGLRVVEFWFGVVLFPWRVFRLGIEILKFTSGIVFGG